MKPFFIATAIVTLILAGLSPAAAQEEAAAPKVVKIEPYIVEKFVKYVIIAVDQANQTGNYEVLHGLGSPLFQKETTIEVLSESFRQMRESGLDLSAVMLYKPRLSSDPELVDGVLRATGYFPTQPLKINFDIVWAWNDSHLYLHRLSIRPSSEVEQAEPSSSNKADKPAEATDSN